jgi:hypothetical protein
MNQTRSFFQKPKNQTVFRNLFQKETNIKLDNNSSINLNYLSKKI